MSVGAGDGSPGLLVTSDHLGVSEIFTVKCENVRMVPLTRMLTTSSFRIKTRRKEVIPMRGNGGSLMGRWSTIRDTSHRKGVFMPDCLQHVICIGFSCKSNKNSVANNHTLEESKS